MINIFKKNWWINKYRYWDMVLRGKRFHLIKHDTIKSMVAVNHRVIHKEMALQPLVNRAPMPKRVSNSYRVTTCYSPESEDG